MKRHIEVVGAVIIRNGHVLCTQRGPEGTLPLMWEFPGGKVEPSETPTEALRREIAEELECEVAPSPREDLDSRNMRMLDGFEVPTCTRSTGRPQTSRLSARSPVICPRDVTRSCASV